MSDSLILALPSKGRLQEAAFDYLAEADMAVQRTGGARGYGGRLHGIPDVAVRFLSAAEIPGALREGDIHIGVTGEDLLREQIRDLESLVHLIEPLPFGHADVVVAVPEAWIDVATMADLDDVCLDFRTRHHRRLRIATKYLALTRLFFAAKGVGDYRIVESAGATEGAPAAGTAEAIVDITSTGSTLAANSLKVLQDGVILRSQAQLAAALTASWGPRQLAAAATLLDRLRARKDSLTTRVVQWQGPVLTEALCAELMSLGIGSAAPGDHELLCAESAVQQTADLLREAGADQVRVLRPDYVFGRNNPLQDGLTAALSAAGAAVGSRQGT